MTLCKNITILILLAEMLVLGGWCQSESSCGPTLMKKTVYIRDESDNSEQSCLDSTTQQGRTGKSGPKGEQGERGPKVSTSRSAF